MHVELLLPGLPWPTAPPIRAARDLALPALAELISLAQIQWNAPCRPETLLAQRFGLEGPRLPYAALRRHGEAGPAPEAEAHWLCCDPVYLHFASDALLVSDASGLAITPAESATLLAGLNETFADIGQFEAAGPTRWYLRLNTEAAPYFHPLWDVNGRPMQLFLPEGDDTAPWARLMNEIQVWLYNHPVNAAREDAGLRSINSVWLWGAGPRPGALQAPAGQLWGDDPTLTGLARLSNTPVAPLARWAGVGSDSLVLVNDLQQAAFQLDLDTWQRSLKDLEERWFAPLLADLQARRITRLQIRAPGEKHFLHLDIQPGSRWKFWRKPVSLDTLLSQAPQPHVHQP